MLQNKERKIKQLKSPIHQRGMSYTFMHVANGDNTQVRWQRQRNGNTTIHSHSSIHRRGMSRQGTNHQQTPSSDHTGNHRVLVDRNSPNVNGTPRLETERLPTSCIDEGLNKKGQQSLCWVSIGTQQIAGLRVSVRNAENWCRLS